MGVLVHYVEGRGAAFSDLPQRLSNVMAGLGHLPGFLGAELLSSPAQPDLCLLASRWSGAVPDFDIPAGCRAWAFTVTETWAPPQA